MEKIFGVRKHPNSETAADIHINPQSWPELNIGDVVELSPTVDLSSGHFLFKITGFDDNTKKDTISVIDTIYTNPHFEYQMFNQVRVSKINRLEDVSVDLVVVICKDTYLSRTDMWRMKQHLENTVVYLDKRITYLIPNMPVVVSEIWSKGQKLTCGYVTPNTRVCYRSSTSVMHIFIQMSCEMWQYDSYGDLYFEKAVSGFLTDLFKKWKNESCCHDVTIVMFSRTFYEAQSFEDFPPSMREGVQRDHDKFFEDFYRVVVQNERYDDWSSSLIKLKKLFINYHKDVLHFHDVETTAIPRAYNSSAAQGNFLEVLNMSLNVHEKYYIDRNFDRLGKTTMVITPGPGVFEVDRELMNVTKHRTINSGCAADLICMGEQPLHAVPLFKYPRSKQDPGSIDYDIPKSWINLSFYTSQSQIRVTSTSQFIPRIKQASKMSETEIEAARFGNGIREDGEESDTPDEDFYDKYDSNIFKTDSAIKANSTEHFIQKSLPRKHDAESRNATGSTIGKKPSLTRIDNSSAIPARSRNLSEDMATLEKLNPERQISEQRRIPSVGFRYLSESSVERDSIIPYNRDSDNSSDGDDSILAGSADLKEHPLHQRLQRRKHIDPFAPSSLKQHMTPNKRRWVHAFPLDRNGMVIKPHLIYSDVNLITISSHKLLASGTSKFKFSARGSMELHLPKHPSVTSVDGDMRSDSTGSLEEAVVTDHQSIMAEMYNSAFTIVSAEGDTSEWSPMITTLVDWRSLSTPALLPITTDYFPSKTKLDKDFVDQVYTLDPLFESPFTYTEFFKELVNTRLALGFQLVLPTKEEQREGRESEASSQFAHLNALKRARPRVEASIFRLSIGKIFHQLSLQENTITVKVQKPKKVMRQKEVQYKYRFLCPDDSRYIVSFTKFAAEQLENYNWNYLDNYVINRGNAQEQELVESWKYWRSRFVLLLSSTTTVKALCDKIKQSNGVPPRCDVFSTLKAEEFNKCNDTFLRFWELVNKTRRLTKERSGNKKRVVVQAAVVDREVKIGTIPTDEEFTLEMAKMDSSKMVESMMDTGTGLTLIDTKSTGLPLGTFISYEAVQWLITTVVWVNKEHQAMAVLKRLLSEQHIQHISGDKNVPMVNGLYLYYFPAAKAIAPFTDIVELSLDSFSREWVEIAFATSPSENLIETEPSLEALGFGYKTANIDIDMNNKSGRIEWASLKYHQWYHPLFAYDLEVDWIVATGVLLFDMINNWSRKVSTYGFHLLPIPVDPFALPTEKNSDPLRGPIFVPLNTQALTTAKNGVDSQTKCGIDDLVRFQEFIIKRFGFIHIGYNPEVKDPRKAQYVHCSGGFFVMIYQDRSSSLENKIGYNWSWNSMMTKKWWSQATGDESFQDSMLFDFRQLCLNSENRLESLWQKWLEGNS